MKQFILAALLTLPATAFAQDSKWQIGAQFQPELTWYRKSYYTHETETKASLNYGAAATLHYRHSARITFIGGVAYISRSFATLAELYEGALPREKQSFNALPKRIHDMNYRIASIPLGLNIYLRKEAALRPFVSAGLAANFLLSSSYTTNVSSLDGTYRRNEWMGMSLTVGGGFDYRLSRRLSATATLSCAVMNPLREDSYLQGRAGPQTLTHSFANVGIGVKCTL